MLSWYCQISSQPIFSVPSCQELSFGIQFDVPTLKVNFDLISPLAPPGGVLAKLNLNIGFPEVDFLWNSSWSQFFFNLNFFKNFHFSGFYTKNWYFDDLEWPQVRSQDIQLSHHWRIKCLTGHNCWFNLTHEWYVRKRAILPVNS